MDIAATMRYARLSPTKARDLVRRLQGIPVVDALKIVEFSERKAGILLRKTLKSAVANAESRTKLSADKLRVKQAVIEEGPRLRRFWARSRGSASPVLKRMCHIRMVLTDDVDDDAAQDSNTSA